MHFSLLLLLLLLITSFLTTALAFPISIPNLFPRACSAACQTETDNLLLHTPIASFEAARAAEAPAYLIWISDGCSDSPDKPAGFNFLPSCHRHDFGYRNYKSQGRLTEANRKIIDDNLQHDLYNECAQYHGFWSLKGVECRRIADLYHAAVRDFGNADFHIPEIAGL